MPVDMEKLVDLRRYRQEQAVRDLDHLRRVVSYGYPPDQIRPALRTADAAVTAYIGACEAVDREVAAHEDEAAAARDRYRAALKTIRDMDWVDNALDPQRPARLAKEALDA